MHRRLYNKWRKYIKHQWQNPECIYAEILNKTSLALMVTSEMLYIFSSFIIKSSMHDVFCFASLRDRIFIFNNWRQTTMNDNVHVSQMQIQTFPSSGPFYFRNHLFVLKYQKILRRISKRILQDMVKRKMKRTKPSCTFGGSTYSEEQKPDTHHMMYHFCCMKLDFVVSRY
jgi:hypothetical protein